MNRRKQRSLYTCHICNYAKIPKGQACPVCSTKYNGLGIGKIGKTTSTASSLAPRLVQKTNAIIMRRKFRNRSVAKSKKKTMYSKTAIVADEKKKEEEGSLLFNLDENKYSGHSNVSKESYESVNAHQSQSIDLKASVNSSALHNNSSIHHSDSNTSKLFHLKKPSFLDTLNSTSFDKSSSYVISKVSDETSRVFDCVPPPKLVLMNRPNMMYKSILDLSLWPINDEQWQYIESLDVLKLETLSLKNNFEISDLTLRAIGRNQGKTLKHVNLDGCNGLQLKDGLLALLTLCKSLESLDVSRCHNVHNDTVKIISQHGKRLEVLKCDECINVNDIGFKYLVENDMPNLRE